MPAPTFTPVNGSSVDVKISAKILENYFQGDCEADGKGVTSNYSQSEMNAGYVRILKPAFLNMKTRQLGSTVNGGSYSNDALFISNSEYMLQVLEVLDEPVDMPFNNFSMVPQLTRDQFTKQIGEQIAKVKNGLCLAAKLYKSWYEDTANQKQLTFDTATNNLRSVLDQAEDVLNEGIPSIGISSFPEDDRNITFLNGYTQYMRATGSFIVGGSNFAQEMLKSGAVDPDSTMNVLRNGFKGIYGTVPLHLISNLKVWDADAYLGFPNGTIAASGLVLVESSAIANHFGLADSGIQAMSPTPNGQGTRVFPNYRMGAATFYTQGNVIVVNQNFVNPFGIFTIFNGYATPTIKGGHSRANDLAAVVTSTTTGKFSATATQTIPASVLTMTAAQTAVAATVAAYAYVVTPAAITTLPAFIAAYNASGATKGIGATLSAVSGATGSYANVVAIQSDGTVSSVGSVRIS